MLGDAPSGFKNSPVYSQLGVGALINNKYLVLTDFQLSIAYYPSIPGTGYNVTKLNHTGQLILVSAILPSASPKLRLFNENEKRNYAKT